MYFLSLRLLLWMINEEAQPKSINTTKLLCQACNLLGCTNCTFLIQCIQCNQTLGYFINATQSLCQPCTIPDCILCQNFIMFNLQLTDQYFDNNGECIKCNLTGCVNCSSLITCYQCDTNSSYGLSYVNANTCSGCNESCICDGYGTPWIPNAHTCTPICGDGLLRLTEYCDNNNKVSGDGCSITCIIEPFWNCDKSQPSICYQVTTVNAEFLSIEKSGCNSFKIISRVHEFHLSQISNNIFILNQGVKITSKEQNGTQILIHAEYNRDIAGQTIMLQFSPTEVFNITYNPTIPALYYSPQQCQIQGRVETMLKAAQIISYTILIVSLLSYKIVGVQLFRVLQLCYFTLSSHSFLNAYLAPLTKFKTFNGLNLQISAQSSELPDSIQKMNMSSSFINNCNVMLIVLFGQILVSFVMHLASKIAQKDKLKTVSLRLLKQGFVTLVLFNIFNISFSAGVHWKYASPNDGNYILSTLILVGTLLAAVVSVLAIELTAKKDYGQFKNKFKKNWVCRLYIPLTIVYRMALGLYSAVKSDYDYGSLLIIAFSLTFIMYTIVYLPFSNVFQNYRYCLVHVTMLYTLLTTNYYRGMKSTTPMEIKGRIYTPAIIELVLMMACIVLSFLVLAYEIYQIIKQCNSKKNCQQN